MAAIRPKRWIWQRAKTLQKHEWLVMAAQDWGTRCFEPMLQHTCINGAEIGGVFQISIDQIGGGKARIFAEEAGFDFLANQEHGRGRPMVGAAAGVLRNTPAKLAERHQQHPTKISLR